MRDSQITNFLSEWLLAIGTLILTVIIATTVRSLLKRFQKKYAWRPVMARLAPTLSNLLYIIGIKISVEVAPLSPKVEFWIENIIFILAALIFLRITQRIALIGIEWIASRSVNSETLQLGFVPLMRNVTTLFVIFAGSVMILKHFNYDVMSLITAFGVSSLAVGLAAKDTLSHMISGFILIIDRNIKPGDRITLGTITGDIEFIGLRSTQIRLGDGNLLIVPNSDLVNTKILNLNLPTKEIASSVQFHSPFDISFSTIKSICLKVLENNSRISKTKETSVNLVNLSDGTQLIQVGFWIPDFHQSTSIVSEINEQLLMALGNLNYLIPSYKLENKPLSKQP